MQCILCTLCSIPVGKQLINGTKSSNSANVRSNGPTTIYVLNSKLVRWDKGFKSNETKKIRVARRSHFEYRNIVVVVNDI